MQRRGGSGQPSKGQRRKAKSKARKVPAVRASIADRGELLDQRTRERDEALEQLSATSKVLKVISRSTYNLQTALDTVVEAVTRLCEAYDLGCFFAPRRAATCQSALWPNPIGFW